MGIEIIFIGAILLLFFMISRNRRRQQAQVAQLRESLVPGSRVMTTSGLHAGVIEIRDTTVVLEIAPGVHTVWSRAAVSRAIDDDATSPVSTTQGASASSTAPVAPAASDASTTTFADGPAAGSGASVSLHKTERPEL